MDTKKIKEEKSTKKGNFIKVLTIFLIVIILLVIAGIIYNQIYAKSIKASAIFGDENCDSILHISTMDIAKHTCEICGAEFEDASTHADICKQCAEETDRCEFCRKKLTEEMKQQRQNLLNQ